MPTIPVSRLVPGVEENGDFLVFYVQSSRPGHEPHRVDLQKFCGNGQCNCEDFSVALRAGEGKLTKLQSLEKGALPHPDLECKHIRRAKRYLLHKVLNATIEKRDRHGNDNKEKAKASARNLGASVPESAQAVETSPFDNWGPND